MYDMDDQDQERHNYGAAALSIGAVVILVAALLLFLGAGRPGTRNSFMKRATGEVGNEVHAPVEETGTGQEGRGDGTVRADAAPDAAGTPPEGSSDGQAAGESGAAPSGLPAGTPEQGQNGGQTSAAVQSGTAPRDEAVQVKSISLTGDRTFMLQCEQMQLSAKIEPANAVNPFLTWTSSNGAVATVTQSGLVTSVGGGDAVITATAPNGVSVDYPLSVSSTQKWMRLSIRTARTESSRIGDEWAYSFEINGQDVTGEETLVVTLGETMSFYSAATEYLDNHDLGTVDGYYTVNKDGFTNGFEVTQEFEIDEKGKGADGGWAEVTVIFTFSNAI